MALLYPKNCLKLLLLVLKVGSPDAPDLVLIEPADHPKGLLPEPPKIRLNFRGLNVESRDFSFELT